MVRIKLFFLLDVLTSMIFALYLYFTRGIDAAFFTGLSIFTAFSPICLILTKVFVLKLARKTLDDEQIKVNNPSAVERTADIGTVAVPMNRFLTDGDYFITDLVPEGMAQSTLLGYAAAAEENAHHPFGRIIYDTAASRGVRLQPASSTQEFPGRGVEATINRMPLRVGNPDWVAGQDVSVSAELMTKIDQLAVHGKNILLLSLGNSARGIIALRDDIKKDVRDFISLLKRRKLETVLLTAAAKKTAGKIAKNFSLDIVRTNLSPEDKAREVQILRAKGHNIAVIGSDFRDLPAMLSGDISVFVNDGSQILNDAESDVHIDFEISSPEKFLTIYDVAVRSVEIIKTNKKIAYLSWIVLVPPAMLTALENSPVPFHPLVSVAGVLIFSVLILINSTKKNKRDD